MFGGPLAQSLVLLAFHFKVVKRHFPDAGEEDSRAVTDLSDATREVTAFLAGLQRLVDADDLLETFAKVTGPHLVVDVFVPHTRVYHSASLHAARNLIQDVALTRILRQIVSKFVFEHFEEDNLLLLHFCLTNPLQ